jgi:ubiquinone/menaquinone biosynthesis C-methylase UbiE
VQAQIAITTTQQATEAVCARTESGNDSARGAGTRPLETSVEFLECPGECIPLEGSSVDPIVWTFALCTIANVADTMQEIGRVLKPGGDLISFEIGVSPDAGVRRWQEWWEPARR